MDHDATNDMTSDNDALMPRELARYLFTKLVNEMPTGNYLETERQLKPCIMIAQGLAEGRLYIADAGEKGVSNVGNDG